MPQLCGIELSESRNFFGFRFLWLYVNSWGKKPKKMKRSKGSGRKVAALNYENICKMRFLNLLKLEYP